MEEKIDLIFGKEASDKLFVGIEKLYKMVSSTLGPKGKIVLIAKENNKIHVTKDGVTVARELVLQDPIENMGVQMIRQAAIKTGDTAGDGTSTSSVLAYHLIQKGISLIRESNIDPNNIKKIWEICLEATIADLRANTKLIINEEQVQMIATISSNNNKELGNQVGALVYRMGANGIITVERGSSSKIVINYVHGIQLDAPYISPYLVNAPKIMSTCFAQTKVFLYAGTIYNIREILTILEFVKKENKPLLLIAEDIDPGVIPLLEENVIKAKMNWAIPKLIGSSEQKKAYMQDIALLTNAQIFNKGIDQFDYNNLDQWLGTADRVENNDLHLTIIVGDKQEQKVIDTYISKLQKELSLESNEMTQAFIQNRINKIKGGVAVIHVGAATELEQLELKDRVEDCVLAAKSAMKEGVSIGAGWALCNLNLEHIFNLLKDKLNIDSISENMIEVISAYETALLFPKKLVYGNAGLGDHINKYMDINTETFLKDAEDCFNKGIIDPTVVLIEALRNAVSVATMILLTEGVIYKEYFKVNGPPQISPGQAYPLKG